MLTRHRVSLVMQSINNWTRAFGRQAMSKWPARVLMLHCTKNLGRCKFNCSFESILFRANPSSSGHLNAIPRFLCCRFTVSDDHRIIVLRKRSIAAATSPPSFVTLTQACPRLCSPIGRILSKLRKFSALSAQLALPFFRRSAWRAAQVSLPLVLITCLPAMGSIGASGHQFPFLYLIGVRERAI